MPRWFMPLDPECPTVQQFMEGLYDDPYTSVVPSDVIGDVTEDFRTRHLRQCKRCQEYGASNIEVI